MKKDFNKLKTIANFFVIHWIECSQETDLDFNKLTEAVTKLKDYQSRLKEMIDKAKSFFFNNNSLILKPFDEPKQYEMSFYRRNIVDVQMFILSKCSFYKIRNNYLFNKKYIY